MTDIMCELMYYVYSDNICEGEAKGTDDKKLRYKVEYYRNFKQN